MTSILVLNWRDICNPARGGAELYTHQIFSRLAKNFDKQVTIFTSSFDSSKPEDYLDGVHIVRRGDRFSIYREARRYYRQNKGKFDLVVDEINTRPFLTPQYVKDRPIIALIHQLAREYWWYETPFPINLVGYYYLEKRWLKNYQAIPTITVSDSTAKDLGELGFSNVSIVHNGIPTITQGEVNQRGSVPTLIFVARFRKVKRPLDAIKAFKMVSKDARLIMIGDGPLREGLQTEHESDKIRFLGAVSDEEKNNLLSSSHVHLAPYLREGWGNSVMEAACVGTPSVGYDTQGLRDSILDGKTGYLVEKFRVDLMAEKIDSIISDPNILERMSRSCIEWSRNFSWDKSAQQFNNLVEMTITDWKRRAHY